jgi:Tfp pilus assembly protein PilF
MKVIIFCMVLASLFSCSSTRTPEEKKAQLFYDQGTKQLVAKKYTKALIHLMKAHKLDPKNSKVNNNLGMAYFFKGNAPIAIKHLKIAIENDKENFEAQNNLATIYMNLDKLNKAEVLYKKLSQNLTYEGQSNTYHNLGLIRLKQHKTNEAYAFFEKAVELDEFYCPSHFRMGKIAYKSGRYRKALEKFKEANQGNCFNSPEPQYHEAMTMIELGEYTSARLRLENLIERFPEHRYMKLAKRKLLFLDQLAPHSNTKRTTLETMDGQNFSPNL